MKGSSFHLIYLFSVLFVFYWLFQKVQTREMKGYETFPFQTGAFKGDGEYSRVVASPFLPHSFPFINHTFLTARAL